jgi:hypothetical protein
VSVRNFEALNSTLAGLGELYIKLITTDFNCRIVKVVSHRNRRVR